MAGGGKDGKKGVVTKGQGGREGMKGCRCGCPCGLWTACGIWLGAQQDTAGHIYKAGRGAEGQRQGGFDLIALFQLRRHGELFGQCDCNADKWHTCTVRGTVM